MFTLQKDKQVCLSDRGLAIFADEMLKFIGSQALQSGNIGIYKVPPVDAPISDSASLHLTAGSTTRSTAQFLQQPKR